MFNKGEQISAFAVYSMKRKQSTMSNASKKLKKKHLSDSLTPKLNQKKQKIQTETTERETAKDKSNLKLSNETRYLIPQVKDNLIENSNSIKKVKMQKPVSKVVSKVNGTVSSNKIASNSNTNNTSKQRDKLRSSTSIKMKEKQQSQKLQLLLKKKKKSKKHNVKISKLSNINLTDEVTNDNPKVEAKRLFEWLIHPLKVEEFFEKNWEKTPLHVKRSNTNYYRLLMSTPLLDKILREHHILFTKNIDITSYTNGIRETHNPPGRAVPSVVWDYYLNGCSVRMLNPQTFIPKLHTLNATLQEFFGCFVGANSYLTPPGSQGFAPHYDDIEAFILQIEGKKRWRLYKPPSENEYLPRYSSKNFTQSEIGKPILDTVLNAGDLLYLPRGTVHQGETVEDEHSLHVTLSVYQRNCWGDFLEKLVPEALKKAIECDSKFREGLPLDYLTYTGFARSENKNARASFTKKVKDLLLQMIEQIDIDKAADAVAKNHIHDFLPPTLNKSEQECSVLEDGERVEQDGIVENRVEIEPDTRIRLLRSHCIRLVQEPDAYRIYYSTENSKEYHEYDLQYLEVGEEFVPAIKEIIQRYPEYICVQDLPVDGEHNKVQIARDLWEKCIVVTDDPLPIIE